MNAPIPTFQFRLTDLIEPAVIGLGTGAVGLMFFGLFWAAAILFAVVAIYVGAHLVNRWCIRRNGYDANVTTYCKACRQVTIWDQAGCRGCR